MLLLSRSEASHAYLETYKSWLEAFQVKHEAPETPKIIEAGHEPE